LPVLFSFMLPLLRTQVSGQVRAFPRDKTVIEMTAEELLQCYPSELRRLEFSPNQDPLESLLTKAGQRLQDFCRDFANTSSKEFVLMQKLGFNSNFERLDSREFGYMMLYHQGENRPLLEEYRTDRQNRPISRNVVSGSFITSGYLGHGLNFHPSYQQGVRFRYLGQMTSKPNAYVVAFAQKPETKDLTIAYVDTNSGISVRLPVQGIAWINPETYQILRMRINLLGAANSSILTEQTTDIQFSEVRFAGGGKPLWLPREVVVTTSAADQIFRNYHRYSDYKIFVTSSDFTIEKPKAHN
jgi:hypothetical protein